MATSTAVPTLIKPYRALGSIIADCVLEEQHDDDDQITQHPVEQGSTVSDNKYALPCKVNLTYGWSFSTLDGQTRRDPNYLQNIYTQLLNLKNARPVALFDIYTGKRHYTNMVVKSLSVTTDKANENILMVRISCQEIIFATTTVVQFKGITADDIAATQAQQQASGQAQSSQQATTQTAQTKACHVQNRGTVQTTPVSGVTAPTLAEFQATD